MKRLLTTIVPIFIGLAIIGFFFFGLMQRPVIAPAAIPENGNEVTIDTSIQTESLTNNTTPDATIIIATEPTLPEELTPTDTSAPTEETAVLEEPIPLEESEAEQQEEPAEKIAATEEPAGVNSAIEEPASTVEPAPTVELAPTEAPLPTDKPDNEPVNESTAEPAEEPILSEESTAETAEDPAATEGPAEPETVTTYDYEIVASYPHDPEAFLQGLVWLDGFWYEGTGLYNESTLRKVDPESGEVIELVEIDDDLFGEGITVFEDKIYQLTWKAQRGFIYDKDTFELIDEFTYSTQGWGITHDGERLIMSDGTATIYFWDPETLEEIGSILVTNQGEPLRNLNELEYIDGLIYANIWQTNFIAIIDPETGIVKSIIDLNGLLDPADVTGPVDVLNGIAYDSDADRLFVTGKFWPKIFEIKLIADEL